MKAKDLAQLLEVIVRKVVREELKPILSEVKKSPKPMIKETTPKKRVVKKDPLDVEHIFEERTAEKQTFTKNSMLNDLLNETANDGEWRNMDSMYTSNQAQGFDRAQMASALGYGEQSVIPTVDVDGKPVDMATLQSSGVADALTRDYSGLMKAINAKKGK